MVVHINVDDMQTWIGAARWAAQQNISMSQMVMFALRHYMHREDDHPRLDFETPSPEESGLCCMAAHANAKPPWTCKCACHARSH